VGSGGGGLDTAGSEALEADVCASYCDERTPPNSFVEPPVLPGRAPFGNVAAPPPPPSGFLIGLSSTLGFLRNAEKKDDARVWVELEGEVAGRDRAGGNVP
jgi:hypothetical protein